MEVNLSASNLPGTADALRRAKTTGASVRLGHDSASHFEGSALTHLRILEAMKPETGYVLLLAYRTDAGKEALVENLMKIVVNAYRPALTQGFCVEYGSITSVPGENEQSRAAFAHRTLPDFELSFDTHTVREPARLHPLSEVPDLAREFAGEGIQLQVLKDEARIVVGLHGREGRVMLRDPSRGSFLHYTWHFPGAPGHSDQPEITLKATARQQHQDELQIVWESWLQSLQPVPMASRQRGRWFR
jgi:hypothetical protein